MSSSLCRSKTNHLPAAARTLVLSTCAAWALTCGSASAQQLLVPAQSEIAFTSKQMGVPVQGHFKKFDAQIQFNPNKLDSSQISLNVDVGSATLGVPESDAELPKAVWFNTPKFPQASFHSSSIKALGSGQYSVQGKISIKGISQDLTVPVSMTQTGNNTVATGSIPLKRLSFKVGENEWADTSMVADEVQVKFKFVLTGVGKL